MALMLKRYCSNSSYERQLPTDEERTPTRPVHNHIHFEQTYPARHYQSDQLFEEALQLQIPKDGMHTFIASRNKLQWFIHVKINFAKWPDYEEDFEIKVLPEMVTKWTR